MKKTTTSLALAALLAIPAAPFVTSTPYAGDQTIYVVGAIPDYVLHDAARSKDLHMRIAYPQGNGKFPLIIFSHGVGGSKDGYVPLVNFWVEHGYVCIQPSHADTGKLAGGRIDELMALLDDENLAVSKQRAADIAAVIDGLDQIEQSNAELKDKIDRTRIGVAGHSLGAYTAMLIGGATVWFKGEPPARVADARVKAILALSPQGTGVQGLTRESFETIDRPMMSMTGSQDTGRNGQKPAWHKEPFANSRPGDKYLVYIEGARHLSFSGTFSGPGDEMEPRRSTGGDDAPGSFGGRGGYGGSGSGGMGGGVGAFPGSRGGRGRSDLKSQQKIFDAIRRTSLAFFDLYLKGSDPAKAFLQSDALSASKLGSIERK